VPVRGDRYEIQAGRFLPSFRAAVLAGGTLINKSATIEAAEIYCSLVKDFFVFGTGVASPSFWSGRMVNGRPWQSDLPRWEAVLRRSTYVGVRGPYSAEILSESGIDGVEVVGDPVLAFASQDGETRSVPYSLGLNVGVSGGQVWGSEDEIARQCMELAKLARQAGWTVRWFVVWPGDLAITRRAALASGTDKHIHAVYSDQDAFLKLVRPLSAFLGMKLHAVALATCAFVPSVMLEYRPKCRDYMASIGQEALTVRTDRFCASATWELLHEIVDHRTAYSEDLKRSVLKLKNFQQQRAREILSRISDSSGR
jgi:polysaccharide pyruvyl transferase WcaK-like protein